MAASQDTNSLLEVQEDVAAASPRAAWRRFAAGSAGLLACGAACASVTALHQQRGAETAMEQLRQPFQMYEGDLAMPDRADQYDGINDTRWVQIQDDENGAASIFVIGDWGSTLPNHITFAGNGWDAKAQYSVAGVFKDRATWAKPQYVLNVGDNFYVEGLEHSCNAPPSDNQGAIYGAFSANWQQMYGPLAKIPWLSVLGNHDYGGWRMDKGWPQQIGFSFLNHNWIMPARYFMKRMAHSNFNIDYFMIDSNAFDAKNPGENPDHNICGKHNYGGIGTCDRNGGPPNIEGCRSWFWASYAVQKQWLEEKLAKSDATWKVVVTHFPCGYDGAWYKGLKAKYGLDLLVTGHRHQQELWWPGTKSKYVRSFMETESWDGSAPACFVTGGGGGIVSQKFGYADYGWDLLWYGFFHLTVSKYQMSIELVDTDGKVKGNFTVFPHGTPKAEEQAKVKLERGGGFCADFCGDMNNP